MRTAELNELIEKACNRFEVDPALVKSPNRGRIEVSDMRHVLIFTIRNCCPFYSLKSIGQMFGGRDYSTVINSITKSMNYMQTDPIYRDKVYQVQEIADQIKNKFGGN